MAKAKAGSGGLGRPVARVNSVPLVEQRRSQIISAATAAIARQGFAKTTVKDIANLADVSIGLVYEYVRSKDDILFLLFEYWGDVWLSAVREAVARPADALERLFDAVQALMDLTVRYPHVTHLFYYEAKNLTAEGRKLSRRAEEELTALVAETISEGIRQDLLRKEVRPQVLASNLLLLTQGWSLKGFLLHDQCSAEEYATWLFDTTIRGSATPKGIERWAGQREPAG